MILIGTAVIVNLEKEVLEFVDGYATSDPLKTFSS